MTFAIPYREIKADLGILISASHNDYRYNGYKLSCANGSQFDPEQRNEMYDKYIANVTSADIRLCPFSQAPKGKLIFLGGESAWRISTITRRQRNHEHSSRSTATTLRVSCLPRTWPNSSGAIRPRP